MLVSSDLIHEEHDVEVGEVVEPGEHVGAEPRRVEFDRRDDVAPIVVLGVRPFAADPADRADGVGAHPRPFIGPGLSHWYRGKPRRRMDFDVLATRRYGLGPVGRVAESRLLPPHRGGQVGLDRRVGRIAGDVAELVGIGFEVVELPFGRVFERPV